MRSVRSVRWLAVDTRRQRSWPARVIALAPPRPSADFVLALTYLGWGAEVFFLAARASSRARELPDQIA